ncbi:MAG: hypothetical protein MJ171_01040 [Clostridia bacterium]|nr:hypothetical protein [Clostridia bacterium]
MEYRFEYQKYGLKIVFGAVPVILWLLLQGIFSGGTTGNQTVFATGGIVSVVIARIIMGIADSLPYFRKTGLFISENGNYRLEMGKKHEFSTVRRISAWKSSLFSLNTWFLKIEAGDEIKIASVPVTGNTPFTDTDLYRIFDAVTGENPSLVQEKTSNGDLIPYSYSVM